MNLLRKLRDQERAATAAEFAMTIPLVVLLTLGVINFSFMLYGVVRMHYAAEDAARCRAVNTCTDLTVATYALSRYSGPMTPTFARSTEGCGNTVTGTATYNVALGFSSIPMDLSTKACYPLQP